MGRPRPSLEFASKIELSPGRNSWAAWAEAMPVKIFGDGRSFHSCQEVHIPFPARMGKRPRAEERRGPLQSMERSAALTTVDEPACDEPRAGRK